MSGFPIVDLVIGIIFVYFMLSIIVSSAVEITLTILKARASLLQTWLLKIFDKKIENLGGDPGISLGQAIMDHGSVNCLSKKGKSTTYIAAKDFAAALLEKISFDPANPTQVVKNIEGYIDVINKTDLLPVDMKRVFLGYVYDIQNRVDDGITKTISGLERFNSKIENWYDSSMERLTGELKRRYSVPFTAIVAVIITVSLNADSIALAKFLYTNTDARTSLANAASNATNDSSFINKVAELKAPGDSIKTATIEQIKQQITEFKETKNQLSAQLPLTWKGGEFTKDGKFSVLLLLAKIAGLLATILAIMMGAPFWFDLMNKISNLRGNGSKPAVSAPAKDSN